MNENVRCCCEAQKYLQVIKGKLGVIVRALEAQAQITPSKYQQEIERLNRVICEKEATIGELLLKVEEKARKGSKQSEGNTPIKILLKASGHSNCSEVRRVQLRAEGAYDQSEQRNNKVRTEGAYDQSGQRNNKVRAEGAYDQSEQRNNKVMAEDVHNKNRHKKEASWQSLSTNQINRLSLQAGDILSEKFLINRVSSSGIKDKAKNTKKELQVSPVFFSNKQLALPKEQRVLVNETWMNQFFHTIKPKNKLQIDPPVSLKRLHSITPQNRHRNPTGHQSGRNKSNKSYEDRKNKENVAILSARNLCKKKSLNTTKAKAVNKQKDSSQPRRKKIINIVVPVKMINFSQTKLH